MLNLDTDIRYLKGVGEKRASVLGRLGIDTVGALLYYFPRSYADFSRVTDIFDINGGEKACIKAKIVTDIAEHRIRKNMTLYRFRVSDGTGFLTIVLFNNKYLASSLHFGSTYLFSGKVETGSYGAEMSSPEIREENDTSIHPVYPLTQSITSKQIEKLVKTAFELCDLSHDVLPESVRRQNKIADFRESLLNIHFPKSREALERAKRRFVFEELFVLRTSLSLMKNKRKRKAPIINTDFIKEYESLLPYSLTFAQKRVISECGADLKSGTAMNRLVEGDVGSGKTAVAAALMYSCAKSGYQSAIMAPTEILAEQHFAFLSGLFEKHGIKVALLTGAVKAAEKRRIKAAIESGEIQVVVGTHALITDDTVFKNLSLVITDEQHRFGVAQRGALASKGSGVHTLVMSATPIPRTMGLIIYGDLDISILDEYPKGRGVVKTYVINSDIRSRAFGFIKKLIAEGRQGYIVCPMVEENEELALAAAEKYYEALCRNEFSNYRVGLLHGKMKPAEKDKIMLAFKDGDIDLLVCTTVIEVGIDVPNAAVMLIENAERFGLSQLHQLRGRIGRGKYESHCILLSDMKGNANERLQVIKNTTDGFKIADEDLRLRGPGDYLGNRQHGMPKLKIADLYADGDIMRLASMAAANLLEHDPKLVSPECLALREKIKQTYKTFIEN